MTTQKTILLVGASGLVGSQVLAQALSDERVAKVIAPTRRPLAAHPKLENPRIHYEYLTRYASWWAVDAVICTLGSTRSKAGSKANFHRIDHDYPLLVAKLAQAHGATTYVLNSAMGADRYSRIFYNKVKGQLEYNLQGLGFASLTFVRPGLIGGQRSEKRLGEWLGLQFLTLLQPLLPAGWRVSPAPSIAKALLEAAITAAPGEHTINSAQLAQK